MTAILAIVAFYSYITFSLAWGLTHPPTAQAEPPPTLEDELLRGPA